MLKGFHIITEGLVFGDVHYFSDGTNTFQLEVNEARKRLRGYNTKPIFIKSKNKKRKQKVQKETEQTLQFLTFGLKK